MFGRRTPPPPRQSSGGGGMVRVHAEPVATADPDWATIERDRSLRRIIGRGLQGGAGIVVDYDRGDPAHSFERVVQPFHDPTAAANRIGMRDGVLLTQSEVSDWGSTNETLTAYEQAQLARIARR